MKAYKLFIISLIIIFSYGFSYQKKTRVKKGVGVGLSINSYSICKSEDLIGKTCYVMVADTTISQGDLEYQEFLRYIVQILEVNGYNIVENLKDAEVAVLFKYGMSDPIDDSYNYSLPVRGVTGVTSSQTTGEVTITGENSATYKQTTRNTPNYGTIGYRTHTINQTVYFRYLTLMAFDRVSQKVSKEKKRLWQMEITSTGSANDMRYVFPRLAIGAQYYIAKDTKGKIDLRIFDNNPDLLKITGY